MFDFGTPTYFIMGITLVLCSISFAKQRRTLIAAREASLGLNRKLTVAYQAMLTDRFYNVNTLVVIILNLYLLIVLIANAKILTLIILLILIQMENGL